MVDAKWLQGEVQAKSLRLIAQETGLPYSRIRDLVIRNKIFVPPQQRLKRRQSPHKSENIKRALRERYPTGRFGNQASNWRGGKHTYNGYVMVHAPSHPRAGRHNRVFEHILVAEKTLGRYITRDEIVHHVNGNKQDNRPENLLVMKRSEHVGYHMKSGKNIQDLLTRLEAYEAKYGKL